MKLHWKLSVGPLSIMVQVVLVTGLLCPLTGGCGYSTGAERGEYILFERGGNAHRMYPDGSGVRLITKDGNNPVCSPAGESIVFTRHGNDPKGTDLFWTDPQGHSTRRLTRGFSIVRPMSISRDGIVAFVTGHLGKQDLYSVQISDGVTLQHTNGFGEVKVLGWSPNGKQLAFAAAKGNGFERSNYYLLDYGSRTITRIPFSAYSYPSLSWSPDGSSVALVQPSRIEIVDVKTDSRRNLPRPARLLHGVGWSPDGQYLAVTRDDEECHKFSGNIYVIRISDNTEKKVSNHWFRCRTYHSPAWSLDGKQLIFLAFRSKGDMDFTPFTKTLLDNIYIVNRDGSGQTNISANEDIWDSNPMWCREPQKQ